MLEHYERIYRFVRGRVDSREVAQDVTQQTYLNAWKARDTIRDPTNTSAWLHVIAKNECRSYWRKEMVRREVLRPLLEVAQEPIITTSDVPDLGEIRELLSELSEEEQQLIHLRFTEELTSHEIGEVFGVSSVGARAKLHRTIEKIRGKGK